MSKIIKIEVCENIFGTLSLCVMGDGIGERVKGGKVNGGRTLGSFTVDADYLVDVIRNYSYIQEPEND